MSTDCTGREAHALLPTADGERGGQFFPCRARPCETSAGLLLEEDVDVVYVHAALTRAGQNHCSALCEEQHHANRAGAANPPGSPDGGACDGGRQRPAAPRNVCRRARDLEHVRRTGNSPLRVDVRVLGPSRAPTPRVGGWCQHRQVSLFSSTAAALRRVCLLCRSAFVPSVFPSVPSVPLALHTTRSRNVRPRAARSVPVQRCAQ